MKKLLAAIGLAALIAGSAAADPIISVSSIGSFLTGGLFGNELDSAFSVSDSQFGKLGKNYLFTGVTNINQSALTNTSESGIIAGFYKAGATPWSVVGVAYHDLAGAATAATESTVLAAPNTVPVVSGTTTTNYEWTPKTTTTKQTGVGYRTINDSVGFYTKLGGFNVGAELNVNLSNAGYAPGSNTEVTVTDFYNTTPGAAPVTATSGSKKTTSVTAAGASNTIAFGIPFYMETGSLSHYAYAKFSLAGADSSNSSDVSYNISNQTEYNTLYGLSLSDADTKNVNKTSVITFAPTYKLQVPGFAGHADNRHFAQLDLSFAFAGAERSANTSTQTLGWTGASYVSTGYNYTSNATDYTYVMTTDITADLTGGTSLYFDLGEGAVFGLMPSMKVGYSINTPAAYATETKQTVKTDSNSNGDYADVVGVDSIVVTTTKYTTSNGAVGTTTNDFAVTLNAPVALKVKPASWFFGIYVASAPNFKMNVQTQTITAASSEATAVTTNSTGTSTVVTKTNAAAPQVTNQTTWTTNATHSFGLFFDLGKSIKMETIMNYNNLLTFDNLKVQAIFALP
ncbi:MAG: hypothetical protein WCT14_08165 [Treponemataceae bacterium]